jgi:enoyl-CoA hydratase
MTSPDLDVAPFTDVVLHVADGVGHVHLNRPRAINALTTEMLTVIGSALDTWEHDDDVALVLLTGEGERGLCAGGDVRSMRESAIAGDDVAPHFFRVEYRVNARIARYPKPVVAIMDGVTMGGGIGLSGHASMRIVTERSVIAMPEVGIGLVPDVGGTYLLSRAPRHTGTHLALTGASVGAADAIALDLADHLVSSEQIVAFVDSLRSQGIDAAIAAHVEAVPASPLLQADWIAQCYAADSVPQVLAALREHPDQAARDTADLIATKSPTALSVTFEALRRAAALPDLEHVLEQEYRVSCACLRTHDLVEGIRAQVVDKDRSPRWDPADLDSVTAEHVASFFAPVGDGLGLVG